MATGTYSYLHRRASHTVMTEVLKVVDDMFDGATTGEPASSDQIAMRRFIEAAHADAFAQALDVKREPGERFDGPLYFRLVFDAVIAGARAEGMTDLADTVERERVRFVFDVEEQ